MGLVRAIRFVLCLLALAVSLTPRLDDPNDWRTSIVEGPPCEGAHLETWLQIRGYIQDHIPRFAERLPFVLTRVDGEMVKNISSILGRLESAGIAGFDAGWMGRVLPARWDDCSYGALTLRMLLLMTGSLAQPSDVAERAVELVHLVLATPWVETLLSRWPVFTTLSALSRWASRYADFSSVEVAGSHAWAAYTAATALGESACDASEAGALLRSRGLLSKRWRQRDYMATLQAEEGSSVELLVEQELAQQVRGDCRWSEVFGRHLGELVPGKPEYEELPGAASACEETPDCAGITLKNGLFTLRLGTPFLELSFEGETSFVLWCPSAISEHPSLPCPFAFSIALLTRALRQLAASHLGNFTPELVVDAQASLALWASHFDPFALGKEMWATEWPLWEVLARMQARIDLLQAPASHATPQTPAPPWVAALQRALGFNDDAWRLATADLLELAELASTEAAAGSPDFAPDLRENLHCTSRRQCSGELFVRLHLLLHKHKRLPLRDPVKNDIEDPLSVLHMKRGRSLVDGVDYDFKTMLREEQARLREGYMADDVAYLDRLMPKEHPLQVDRRQLAFFIQTVLDIVTEGPLARCLEWDEPFLLVRAFAGLCRWNDVFSYAESSPEDPRMGMPGHTVYPRGSRQLWGDLEHPLGPGLEEEGYDLILCPFVFEHVSAPFIAMANLAKALRPGGFILWAAPMFEHYHGAPHDYFRYTTKGARALAERSGLEVVKLYAPGDLGLVSGVMMGMRLPYWSEKQVLMEHMEPGADAPTHPLNVFMLLRKPRNAESE